MLAATGRKATHALVFLGDISLLVLRAFREYAQLDPPTRPRREKFRRERWQQLTDFGAR